MIEKQAVRFILIDADYAGQRIDNFLLTALKKIPKTRIYRLIRKGEVRVNKKRVDVAYRIQAGDSVRIPPVYQAETAPPVRAGDSLLTLLASRILYEDERLLVLNKPAGIPVHGGSQVKIGVIEALRDLYPKLKLLELAHRLDADTSGCLIIAKKRSVLRELHGLLREGKVHKVYQALTLGHWRPEDLRVDVALQKNYLAGGERVVKVDRAGKSALTVFSVLQKFKEASLVEAVLHTGRTHQIRVHARYRGHPLAGDVKYGDRAFDQRLKDTTGLKRMFLHAVRVEFVLPMTGEVIKVTAPLDLELQACLQKLS